MGRHADIHRFCFCGIAAGNVINIFLIKDVLLYPSAFHLLLIRMLIFMTHSMDRIHLYDAHDETLRVFYLVHLFI